MVARPRDPDRNNVSVTVKVSDNAAARMDAARGGLTRSAWARQVILAALGTVPMAATEERAPAARTEAPAPGKAKPRRAEPEAPAVTLPSSLAGVPLTVASALPKPRRCNHPGKRSVGGWCAECDHLIQPGGSWA